MVVMRASVIPLLWILQLFAIAGELQPGDRGPTKEASIKGEPSKEGPSNKDPSDEDPEPGPSKKRKITCTECGECVQEKCMCYGKYFYILTLLRFII